MAVRIGLSAPTMADFEYNQRCAPEYARAIEQAGGEVVALPLGGDRHALKLLFARCDGFVTPGSPADVNPGLYGEETRSGTAAPDAAREEADTDLLEHAAEAGKPVLAICFGLQLLNVWRGGSLIQDLAPLPVNHGAGASVAVAHTSWITGQSLLAGLLTAAEAPAEGPYRRLPVNSSHHQAISRAGEGLTVVARCPQDGVVEAVEGRIGSAAMLGVQWHPERSTAISPASRALFQWLVAAAADGCHGE